MRQCDRELRADWTFPYGKSCHTAVISEERLQVRHSDSGGVGGHSPGTIAGHVQQVHYVVADDPVLLVKARRVPGEGEGVGGGPWGCQV